MQKCKRTSRVCLNRPPDVLVQLRTLPPLLNRHVWCNLWPDILGTRANQAVVGILLQHMRRPARDATASKNGRIQINWNAQHKVDRGGIEINVCIEPLVV